MKVYLLLEANGQLFVKIVNSPNAWPSQIILKNGIYPTIQTVRVALSKGYYFDPEEAADNLELKKHNTDKYQFIGITYAYNITRLLFCLDELQRFNSVKVSEDSETWTEVSLELFKKVTENHSKIISLVDATQDLIKKCDEYEYQKVIESSTSSQTIKQAYLNLLIVKDNINANMAKIEELEKELSRPAGAEYFLKKFRLFLAADYGKNISLYEARLVSEIPELTLSTLLNKQKDVLLAEGYKESKHEHVAIDEAKTIQNSAALHLKSGVAFHYTLNSGLIYCLNRFNAVFEPLKTSRKIYDEASSPLEEQLIKLSPLPSSKNPIQDEEKLVEVANKAISIAENSLNQMQAHHAFFIKQQINILKEIIQKISFHKYELQASTLSEHLIKINEEIKKILSSRPYDETKHQEILKKATSLIEQTKDSSVFKSIERLKESLLTQIVSVENSIKAVNATLANDIQEGEKQYNALLIEIDIIEALLEQKPTDRSTVQAKFAFAKTRISEAETYLSQAFNKTLRKTIERQIIHLQAQINRAECIYPLHTNPYTLLAVNENRQSVLESESANNHISNTYDRYFSL